MTKDFLKGKRVLITGGTGSFGQKCVELLQGKGLDRIMVLSRDELKQSEMQQKWPDTQRVDSAMRYFVGDVRDKDKLLLAFKNVDMVIHAAAMKQIPACEYNPSEAVKTNVIGAQNVIEAAVERKVERVLAISSDKAVNPINLYGATKLVSEKLFVAANTLRTKFSLVRYGNVLGSRGSVLPIFQRQAEKGILRITDDRMTRFWIVLDDAVNFSLDCLERMMGGEIFVPKMVSSPVVDLANAAAGDRDCGLEITGIRPGEKLHETLVSDEEVGRVHDAVDSYVILPSIRFFNGDRFKSFAISSNVKSYTSQTNPWQAGPWQLAEMIKKVR